MNNRRFAVTCLAVTFAASLPVILTGCSAASAQRQVFTEDSHRYVCVVLSQTEYYWGEIKAGIASADEDFNCFTKIETFERFDAESQLELLEKTAYFQVDGIITIGQPYSDAINSQLEKCRSDGIPVILLDTDSTMDTRDYYIGTDNYQAGVQAAQYLLQDSSGPIHAAVIVSSLEDANQNERYMGFRNTLESSGRNADVLLLDNEGQDNSHVHELLDNNLNDTSSINMLFCAEASTSRQTGLYLQSTGLYQKIRTIGFDDVDPVPDYIKEGILSATILQDTYNMGYEAVQVLEEMNGNASVPSLLSQVATQNEKGSAAQSNQIITKTQVVTADNIGMYIPDTEVQS